MMGTVDGKESAGSLIFHLVECRFRYGVTKSSVLCRLVSWFSWGTLSNVSTRRDERAWLADLVADASLEPWTLYVWPHSLFFFWNKREPILAIGFGSWESLPILHTHQTSSSSSSGIWMMWIQQRWYLNDVDKPCGHEGKWKIYPGDCRRRNTHK